MADEETVEEEGTGLRSQQWKHDAMVEWLESEEGYGYSLDELSPAEVIAVAFAYRVRWRNSQTYVDLVEAHKAEAEEEKAAKAEAREAAKAEKAKEREAAKAAKEAAKAEAEGKAKETAKATKPAAKASKAAKPAAATKRVRKGTAAPAEDPFEA